jgi:hypothetical protein
LALTLHAALNATDAWANASPFGRICQSDIAKLLILMRNAKYAIQSHILHPITNVPILERTLELPAWCRISLL